jgi:hypothetical protein
MNALTTYSTIDTGYIYYIGDDGIFHSTHVGLQYRARTIGNVFYLHNTLYIAVLDNSHTYLYIVSDHVVIDVGMDGVLGDVYEVIQLSFMLPANCVRICASEYVVYIASESGKIVKSLRIDKDRKWRAERLMWSSSNVVDLFTYQRFSVKDSNGFSWQDCDTGDTFRFPYSLDGMCGVGDRRIWDGVSVLWQRADRRFYRVMLYDIRKCLIIYDYIVEASYVWKMCLLTGNTICVVCRICSRKTRYIIINITDGSEYMLTTFCIG